MDASDKSGAGWLAPIYSGWNFFSESFERGWLASIFPRAHLMLISQSWDNALCEPRLKHGLLCQTTWGHMGTGLMLH